MPCSLSNSMRATVFCSLRLRMDRESSWFAVNSSPSILQIDGASWYGVYPYEWCHTLKFTQREVPRRPLRECMDQRETAFQRRIKGFAVAAVCNGFAQLLLPLLTSLLSTPWLSSSTERSTDHNHLEVTDMGCFYHLLPVCNLQSRSYLTGNHCAKSQRLTTGTSASQEAAVLPVFRA